MKKLIYTLMAVLFISLSSCKKNDINYMHKMAQENIELSLENHDYLKFYFNTTIDSTFGYNNFNVKDSYLINNILKYNSLILDSITHNFQIYDENNIFIINNIHRQFQAIENMRNKNLFQEKKGAFTGYKLRVVYQYMDKNGQFIINTVWIFFDKDKRNIIGTFELPLIDKRAIKLALGKIH